jgi:hypothetical protein
LRSITNPDQLALPNIHRHDRFSDILDDCEHAA